MDMRGHNSRANPGNWIAVSRDMRDHGIVGMGQPVKPADPARGSYSRYEAWQDLLMEAQWKPFEVINRGKSVTLRRGQLMAARSWLAARWNWTEKTVRIFIAQLEEEFMVRSEMNTTGSRTGRYNNILTICNYDIYQTVFELMQLTEGANQGPDERPDEGPDKGPDETEEKPFNNNVISLSEVKSGPDERPDEGPDKGPQYNNVKNNVLGKRENARERADGSSRLSEAWFLPNEWGQWSMHECKRDRDWVIVQAAKFKDYWLSVPDSKGFKKNWRSTWQNWCRNTLQREAKYGQPPPKPKSEAAEWHEKQRAAIAYFQNCE